MFQTSTIGIELIFPRVVPLLFFLYTLTNLNRLGIGRLLHAL